MRLLLASALFALLGLSGCVEAEEEWAFDEKGGGTYALTVRWNADLWRRVGDVLGARVMKRLVGDPFPLRRSAWADGLRGLEGVEVLSLEQGDTENGMRQIAAKLKFKRVADLLGWEVLARRTIRMGPAPAPGEKPSREKPAICKLYMEPIARVPVVDRVGALLNAVEKPPAKAEGPAAAQDPGPLERFGLERETADLVWRMVKLPLARVKLTVRLKVLGEIVEENEQPALVRGRTFERSWDFAALRNPKSDRRVRFAWRPRAFDIAPTVKHTGDRAPRLREAVAKR